MSWVLGKSIGPVGQLWSESKEIIVAVHVARDPFDSLGVRFSVRNHSLRKGESTLGLRESFQGGQAGDLRRGAPLAGEHRARGQKTYNLKSTWSLWTLSNPATSQGTSVL